MEALLRSLRRTRSVLPAARDKRRSAWLVETSTPRRSALAIQLGCQELACETVELQVELVPFAGELRGALRQMLRGRHVPRYVERHAQPDRSAEEYERLLEAFSQPYREARLE